MQSTRSERFGGAGNWLAPAGLTVDGHGRETSREAGCASRSDSEWTNLGNTFMLKIILLVRYYGGDKATPIDGSGMARIGTDGLDHWPSTGCRQETTAMTFS